MNEAIGKLNRIQRSALIAAACGVVLCLAGLLQARGDRDEASEIYVKLTQREEDPTRVLRSIDSLLTKSENAY